MVSFRPSAFPLTRTPHHLTVIRGCASDQCTKGRITAPVMGSFTAGAAPGSPGGAGSAGTEPNPQHTIIKCALGETLCAPRRAATLSEQPLPPKSSGRRSRGICPVGCMGVGQRIWMKPWLKRRLGVLHRMAKAKVRKTKSRSPTAPPPATIEEWARRARRGTPPVRD